jgi:hypothetical protein
MASPTTEVDDALIWAAAKFAAASGDQLDSADRIQALAYATLLDDYNNGEIGPGHCGDEPLKGTLTVTKVVRNNDGGSKEVANFPLFVDMTPVTSGIPAQFDPGTHVVSETQQAGYTGVISGDCAPDGSITLAVGDDAACTITNDDQMLIVVKVLTNDDGGTKTSCSDFLFNFVGTSYAQFEPDCSNAIPATTGTTYLVTEVGVPLPGYDTTYAGCTNVQVPAGGTATCTITNNDKPATLIVKKTVVNNNGGTTQAGGFSFSLDGGSTTTPFTQLADPLKGQNTLSLDAGTYTVTEPAVTGYTTTYDGCTGILIASGETRTCTITNDDIAPQLTLVKTVIKNDVGQALPDEFLLTIGGNPATSGTPYTLVANTPYAIDESELAGYDFVSITGNPKCPALLGGTITLAPGDDITCTITNDDDDLVHFGYIFKSAVASITNTYTWTIDKVGPATVTVPQGQPGTVDYDVTVTPVLSQVITAHGDIGIINPYTVGITVSSVTDTLSGNIPATVTCDESLPHVIPAGDHLLCHYSATLPNADPRTNTAKVVVNGHEYTVPVDPLPVPFETPTEVDECVTLDDDKYVPSLGTVCASDIVKTKSYSLTIGPYQTCGQFPFVNTASFDTTDTHATGSDQWTVMVSVVQCVHGCTYTHGYYKNHHEHPAWDLITPDGGDSQFFINPSKTWYQAIDTNPSGHGPSWQAYYILARQYIAAKLNLLKGASSTPEVDAAITWAENFFNTYTHSSNIPSDVRDNAKDVYAPLLDDYNNGRIGPGHCGDEIVGMMQSESSEEPLLGGDEIGLMGASGSIEETTTPPVEEVTTIEETEVVEATPTTVAEITDQAMEEVVTEATPTQVEETPTPSNP